MYVTYINKHDFDNTTYGKYTYGTPQLHWANNNAK